jgi:hypothetical protein
MPLEATEMPVDAFNAPEATQVAPDSQNSPVTLSGRLNAILDLKTDYMRMGDPTEYAFAKRYFGTWDAWEILAESSEGAPIIGKWRKELALKLASEALARILEAAKGETRDALGANKYIYEALVSKEDRKQVGRPSREAIAKEAYKIVEDDRMREEAYNRIFNSNELLSTEVL